MTGQRATKDQLRRIARLLVDHVTERMASGLPEDRTPALIREYRAILSDAGIKASAERSTPIELPSVRDNEVEFAFPFAPRKDEDMKH